MSVRYSGNHPANNGLVLLSAWVEPALREYVRLRAEEAREPVSKWVGDALRKAVAAASPALRDAPESVAARMARAVAAGHVGSPETCPACNPVKP